MPNSIQQSSINESAQGSLGYKPEEELDILSIYAKMEKEKVKLSAGTYATLEKMQVAQLEHYKKQKEKIEKDLTLSEEEKIKRIAQLKINTEKDLAERAKKAADDVYKTATLSDKKRLTAQEKDFKIQEQNRARASREQAKRDSLDRRTRNREVRKAALEELGASKKALEYSRQESKLAVQESKSRKIYDAQQRNEKRAEAAEILKNERRQIQSNKSNLKEQKVFLKDRMKEIQADKGRMAELRKNAEKTKDGKDKTDEQLALEDAQRELGLTLEELNEGLEDAKKSEKANKKDSVALAAKEAAKAAAGHAIGVAIEAANKALDDAMDLATQYNSKISTRLLGTEESFNTLSDAFKDQLALSPFVTQKKVLESLDKAVDEGIAYNIEQRAFLASITDKIVTTFDAFDSNLMRLIRLQQADTTSARMGLEAQLNQFFNSQFADTSYLKNGFDSVSQALLDANSQMTRDMSVSFEYNVQKWLGSLASLGFGTDTLTTIATGINYLGSGNVQELTSNEQLNSLMAIAASRSGENYSDMLVNGINDSQANNLMKAMVEYLKEIADSENQVVKSAYGDVFNLTQSDFRALSNLATADITKIYDSSMDYASAVQKTQSLMNTIYQRMTMGEMIDNVFDNFMYSAAESIVNNPVTAIMYKTISAIESVTGGIDIMPFLNIKGFGLDIDATLEGTLKAGMFGLSALSQIGNMISSVSSGGGTNLSAWDFAEATPRGGEFSSLDAGVNKTRSLTAGVATANSSDTKQGALADTEQDQEAAKKNSKEMQKDEFDLKKFWEAVGVNENAVRVVPEVSEAILVYDDTNKKLLDSIYNHITGTIKVEMKGMDNLVASLTKPSVTTVTFDDKAKTTINEATKRITTALGETDSNASQTVTNNKSTLKQIYELLSNTSAVNVNLQSIDTSASQLLEDIIN